MPNKARTTHALGRASAEPIKSSHPRRACSGRLVPPPSPATGEGDYAQHGGGGRNLRRVRHPPPPPPSAVPLPRYAGEEPGHSTSTRLRAAASPSRAPTGVLAPPRPAGILPSRKDQLVKAGAVAIQRTPAGGADLGQDFLQPRAHPVRVGVMDRRRVIVAEEVGLRFGSEEIGLAGHRASAQAERGSLSAILPAGPQNASLSPA
jgi:hypothetical protein